MGDILSHLKSKGVPADIKLCENHHIKLVLKHHQANTLHNFNIKLYKEEDGMYTYEFGAYSEPEFNYLKELVKDI